jgi:zinc protease
MKRALALIVLVASAAAASAQTETRSPVIPFPDWRELKFPPLRSPEIPNPEEFTLPNGMHVYLLEDHELPLVNGTALVRTGNLFDPANKVGLADITGAVLRSGGTKKLTGDQIDVMLENVAASVESEIGESSGDVSFNCLKENLDLTLGIFHDLLTAPEFREDKIELLKTQYRSAIARRNDDAAGIANREFADTVYGHDNSYGWMPEYATIGNIHRDDVIAFYKRYYFPVNITLAVYGDFKSAEMREKLTHLFADWTCTQPPVPKFPAVGKVDAAGIFPATKTDVNQTFFEVGHLGGTYNDKDYAALAVASDILGDGFSSRLVQQIRTKLGYVYNIGGGWGAHYDHPGLFEISGSTQSKYTIQTLQAIREEIEKLRTGEVSDEELRVARDKVENSFVFAFDRPSKTLDRIVRYDYFGYPRDFIFRFQKAVESVTKADVLRACREHFDPKRLTIVAVGNPADFGQSLNALGMPVKPIDLTIPK